MPIIPQIPPARCQIWADYMGTPVFHQFGRLIGALDLHTFVVLGDDTFLQIITNPELYLKFDTPVPRTLTEQFYFETINLRVEVPAGPAILIEFFDLTHATVILESDGSVLEAQDVTSAPTSFV